MNKNSAIANINKYGKIGKIIAKIMLGVIGFLAVMTLIASIGIMVIPDDLLTISIGTQAECVMNMAAVENGPDTDEMNEICDAINNGIIKGGLNLGAVRMTFDKAEIVDNTIVTKTNDYVSSVSLNKLGSVLMVVALFMVMTCVAIIFAIRLCKAFEKCESPFENDVINKMRAFAFSLLPWALFESIPQDMINRVFYNNIDLNLGINMNVIFTVLIIFALTTVFKYGAILQQESDETL